MAIVQGLFGDMLPPTMQDGGGRGAIGMPLPPSAPQIGLQAPVMQPQVAPPVQPQVQPPVQEQVKPVAQQPTGIVPPQQPQVAGGFTMPQGFDLSGLGTGGMFNFGQLQQTQQPQDYTQAFNDYSSFLGSVQSGNTAKKVNRRDDIYNNQQITKYQGDPSDLRASVGLSDAFSVYDNPEAQITGESVQGAYQALTGASSPQEALSSYYGFDFQPAVNEGANYKNASKYGVNEQTMGEFHSLVEPILQKSIPYIQATQGLNYTDALEYAYTHDPMVNALYQSYGVDLYRQTDDGSTYIFDPIAGQEIRTLEVKDPKFKDFAPAIALAVVTAGAGSAIGGAIANSSLGASLGAAGSNALGSAIAGIGSAAASGARGSDLLTAGVLSGLGGYAKGLNEVAQGAAAGSQAAIDATAQADIFNNISKVANAADALANKNYFKLLNMGLEAGGMDSFNTLTANKLNELGGSDGTILGLNVDRLAPAVTGFAKDILKGKDVNDALRGGVLEYIKQGGALDIFDIDFPDFDLNLPEGVSGLKDFLVDNWKALQNTSFVQAIREGGRVVDEGVLQPIKDKMENLGQQLDDFVDTPDSIKAIEDWLKDLEMPDLRLDLPSLGFAGGAGGSGGGTGDFTMSSLDTGIDTVKPSELFAQKDYLAGLLD